MAAYLIVDIEITDPIGFNEYRKAVVPLIEKFGGKYVAVGDQIENLEGNWLPKRIVMIEFPCNELRNSSVAKNTGSRVKFESEQRIRK